LTDLAVASDGNVWITLSPQNYLAKLNPSSGQVTTYPLQHQGIPPNDSKTPGDIVEGADGAMWFVETDVNAIGRVSATGAITEYQLPNSNSSPNAITKGPDGALWFTEGNGNRIGRIDTSGVIAEYTIPAVSASSGSITLGPDGALWFTESALLGSEEIPLSRIGRVTTDGVFTHYTPYTDPSQGVYTIRTGPDGALWYTKGYSDQIGRMTTAGVVTEYTIPTTNSQIMSMTAAGDSLWFTEYHGNKIGRIAVASLPVAPANLSGVSPTQEPALSWNAVTSATSYDIYRDNVKIGSTVTTTYTDVNVPEGTHQYYVVAVNQVGPSMPSNTITVLVDRTKPTIAYTLSPPANSYGWNNSNVQVTFTCTDTLTSITSCSSPSILANEGANQTVTGVAIDAVGNTNHVTTNTINIDRTAPSVSSLSLSGSGYFSLLGLKFVMNIGAVNITASAGDNLSGVLVGEYYLDSDPGAGNGVPMTYGSGSLTSQLSRTGLSVGNHTLYVRSKDKAGNWSVATSTTFICL
jgi:streptogramin lyase